MILGSICHNSWQGFYVTARVSPLNNWMVFIASRTPRWERWAKFACGQTGCTGEQKVRKAARELDWLLIGGRARELLYRHGALPLWSRLISLQLPLGYLAEDFAGLPRQFANMIIRTLEDISCYFTATWDYYWSDVFILRPCNLLFVGNNFNLNFFAHLMFGIWLLFYMGIIIIAGYLKFFAWLCF